MSKKVMIATTLLLVLVIISVSLVSYPEVVKNDVFNDSFFSDVTAAELGHNLESIYPNTDRIKGYKLEKLKKVLSGLELEKTDETLMERIGVSSIFLKKSNGDGIYIAFSAHLITLSKTENYYCEEFIPAKLLKPFGIEVDDEG